MTNMKNKKDIIYALILCLMAVFIQSQVRNKP